MQRSDETPDAPFVLPIVVGAHLRAEVHDRPTAMRLRDALESLLEPDARLRPVVVTDLWYLNDDALRAQPAISVGMPEVNAFSAFLADRLPSLLAVDERMIVQMDLELVDPVASCWGVDAASTAEAVRHFLETCAADFLRAATSAANARD